MCLRITSGALLSKRAPSTTRPSLRFRINAYGCALLGFPSIVISPSNVARSLTGFSRIDRRCEIQDIAGAPQTRSVSMSAVSAAGCWRRLG